MQIPDKSSEIHTIPVPLSASAVFHWTPVTSPHNFMQTPDHSNAIHMIPVKLHNTRQIESRQLGELQVVVSFPGLGTA
jgi:hypothetical protein